LSKERFCSQLSSSGLVAAYYFGAMFGCFFAGWFGDAYGRKKGVWFGSLWCILGGALMSASQNSNMFICARVIAGIGIGFINTLIPPWVSELAKAHSRGVNFTFVFISNCECVCPAQFHFG
jgi:MFS family permease